MKAIAFFTVVFLSMLSAFLLATGEVQRWISGETGRSGGAAVPWVNARGESESENLLRFPVYNPEEGRLSFTITAELSQEDFDAQNRLDNIDHLTLRKGVLEIPLHEGLELPNQGSTGGPQDAGGETGNGPSTLTTLNPPAVDNGAPPAPNSLEAGKSGHVVMTFEAAEWRRQGEEGNDSMHVVLRDGEGKTSDGFQFFFETLNFYYEKGGSNDQFTMQSDKPVSIENSAFRLSSPNGLEGTFEQEGNSLESLTFLPPVTVEIDPEHAPFLPVPVAATSGAQGSSGARPEKTPTDSPDGSDESRGVRITTAGPLVLHQDQERTTITLNKNIVVRPVAVNPEVRAGSGSRFECQHLELLFTKQERRLVPERAIATWPEGRVKAFFHSATKKNESYVLDGERLIWTYRLAPGAKDAAGAVSEAELVGKPTLRGSNGSEFHAKNALLRLAEGSILLNQVDGHFQAITKPPKSRNANPNLIETGQTIHIGEDSPTEERERRRRLNMESSELEIFFTPSKDGGNQELSHFVARSEEPGGVRIESPGEKADQPFRLAASRAVYQHGKQVVTLNGTGEEQPTFRQGNNAVTSSRVQLFLKDEVAVFQEQVVARIQDVGSLKKATPSPGPPDALRRTRGEAPFELTANLLQAGFDGTAHELLYLHARGTERQTAQLRSLDDNEFTLDGDDMRWDREQETMTVEGSAVLAYKGGKLAADKITYNTKSRLAILEKGATLHATRGDQRIQLSFARGQVELFDLRPDGDENTDTSTDKNDTEAVKGGTVPSPGRGLLSELRDVKAFHAYGDRDQTIDLTVLQPDGRVVLRGRAQEAEWNGEKQELCFSGDSDQELHIADEQIEGPIYAPEITYLEKEQRLVLKGKVRGRLRQGGRASKSTSASAPKSPAGEVGAVAATGASTTGSDEAQGPIWKYESGRLEIDLRRNPQTGNPEVVSVSAHDFVRLEDDRGLQVLGDELEYDATSHRVHLFSPAGRPQTLSYSPPNGQNSPDRIGAQEIWILPYVDERARFGGSRQWLQVQFKEEVTATLHPSSSNKLKKSPPVQLDSETLTLRVDPAHSRTSAIQQAEAFGNVVFRSREYTGTGDRADYDEALAQVTLSGNPARVTARRTWEGARILCQLRGDDIRIDPQPQKSIRRTRR